MVRGVWNERFPFVPAVHKKKHGSQVQPQRSARYSLMMVVALTPVQAACMDMQGQTQVSDKFYTALKPYHKNDSRKVR